MSTNHFEIIEKPENISLKQILDCLKTAHSVNQKKGLNYATASLNEEEFKVRLNNAKIYIVLDKERVVATASLQLRDINYWYHSGPIGLMQSMAVLPEYSGQGLAKRLLIKRIEEGKKNGINVFVADSAETNMAIRKLYLSNGFHRVDCYKYSKNNFISVAYALWVSECPYSKVYVKLRYTFKRLLLSIKMIFES